MIAGLLGSLAAGEVSAALPRAVSPFAAAEAPGRAAQSAWTAATAELALLQGVPKPPEQSEVEGFSPAAAQQPPQIALPPMGPSDWGVDAGLAGQSAAFDEGVLSEDPSRMRRGPPPEEAARLEVTRERAAIATPLEGEIATASRAASTLARDAAVLSQELSKLNGMLGSAPSPDSTAAATAVAGALRSEQDSLQLLESVPPRFRPIDASTIANLKLSRPLVLLGNSTGNSTQYTGFRKYFTLNNKIPMWGAIVYWSALFVICLGLCGWCVFSRLRRV